MKHHCTPIRLANSEILNSDNIKYLWGYGAVNFPSVLIGMQSGTATLEDDLADAYRAKT